MLAKVSKLVYINSYSRVVLFSFFFLVTQVIFITAKVKPLARTFLYLLLSLKRVRISK